MASVEFRSCNLSSTKTNQIITSNFEYVGKGSINGSMVKLLEDVYAETSGYPNIRKGDRVYKKGEVIFVNHTKTLEGYKVINNSNNIKISKP